ncbi:polyprenyl synthetase family protein, partial [Listeria monocytogenes]|nr:polyprenyl synthetase family protein [Listeria monocytogenes]
MFDFWIDYPTIEQRLKTVCSIIEEHVTVRNKEIQDVLIDFTYSGGKMLRPALFFLFADLGDPHYKKTDQLTKIAASLEILHMATLIHDDIIDDSPLRRSQVTVQAKYGKDIAVYTGDLLFTQFFELLIESMNGSPFLKTNAQAMKRLLLGELDQMHTRYNIHESIDDYLQSINGKT